MEQGLLSQQIDFDFLRGVKAERIAFGLLSTWCIMPLFVALVAFVCGMTDGTTINTPDVPDDINYFLTIRVFRRSFLVLGSITIIFAATQLVSCWKTLISKDFIKKHPWILLLALLLLWAAISTSLSDNPIPQFVGSSIRCDGLFSYFIYAAIFCCALRIQNNSYKKWLFRLFVGVVDVLSIIMICQAAKVYPFYQVFEAPYAAVFNQFNHFGYMLCMSSLCAVGLFLYDDAKRFGVAHIASFAFLVLTLLLNDTFGCYLAVFVGVCVTILLWIRSGRKAEARIFIPMGIFIILSLISFFGLLAPLQQGGGVAKNFFQLGFDLNAIGAGDDAAKVAGTGRMTLWIEALKMIPYRPVFGYGPEGLMQDYAILVGTDRPHCELIQYAVFLGIPALILYLSAIISLFICQWNNLKELSTMTIVAAGVVVGYLASSLVGNTMFNTAPYFWMMLGFASCLPGSQYDYDTHCFGIENPVSSNALPHVLRLLLYAIAAVAALLLIASGLTL